MNGLRKWIVSSLALAVMAAGATQIAAQSAADKPEFSLRKVEAQVVLYTIYRGSYDKAGAAIGNLFALAGKNGIMPRGAVTFVYLNSPQNVSKEHWLTEIRIPVGKEALKLAGTLGEMTDVKQLPAMEVVVTTKPEGQADPSPIYDALTAWLLKEGYIMSDGPMETFAGYAKTTDYAKMKTEIMAPVKKLAAEK